MVPLLDDMVRTGVISPAAARTDPRRSLLRSAIAGKTVAMTDLCDHPLQLQTGDLVMLASDGVETLSEAELTAVLQHADALALDALAARLLAGVEDAAAKNQDNASIILFRY
jgi:serine/threonine protein phosphatase PrpC